VGVVPGLYALRVAAAAASQREQEAVKNLTKLEAAFKKSETKNRKRAEELSAKLATSTEQLANREQAAKREAEGLRSQLGAELKAAEEKERAAVARLEDITEKLNRRQQEVSTQVRALDPPISDAS
jgi:CRISPR/Cas system CSM-associated protein Csm2 small subunit